LKKIIGWSIEASKVDLELMTDNASSSIEEKKEKKWNRLPSWCQY
jgi:hypothetical protein